MRELQRELRQGGLVAREELNLEPSPPSGEASGADREYAQLLEFFARAEICPTTGMRLFRIL